MSMLSAYSSGTGPNGSRRTFSGQRSESSFFSMLPNPYLNSALANSRFNFAMNFTLIPFGQAAWHS